MTQAELGNAAAKLGGSVLSGMRTLGGMAISAARAGVAAAVAEQNTATGPGTGFGSMFFSKSAPAATGSPHEYQTTQDRRRRSLRVSPPADCIFDHHTGAPAGSMPPPSTSPIQAPMGCNVVVVDLQPL